MREAEGIDEGADPSTQESPAPGDRRRVTVDGVEYVQFERARRVYNSAARRAHTYKKEIGFLNKESKDLKETIDNLSAHAKRREGIIDRVSHELHETKMENVKLKRDLVVRGSSQTYIDLQAENKQLGDRIAELEKVNRGYDAKLEAIKKVVDDSNINRRQLRERIAAINTLPGSVFLNGVQPIAFDTESHTARFTGITPRYDNFVNRWYPDQVAALEFFRAQNSCKLCTRIHDELVVNPDCLKHGVNQAWRNGLRS